jgi:3-oxoacyl-[acyl-carrier protein] reductase
MTVESELINKVAWVTGGSRGIGAAISTSLSDLGFKVQSLSTAEIDLGDPSSRRDYILSTKEWPSVLVLNAGINEPELFEIQSEEKFNNILEVNFLANVAILQCAVAEMKKNNFGRIIAISSLFANRAKPGRSAYASSKAALEALIRHIAVENATFGVTANIVSPGYVDTDLTRKNNSESQIHDLEQRIPLGRLAQPEEIASVVAFLISEGNTYLTGQTINVDGGVSLL